ncbi:MAG: hypothetical protein H6738_17120 [Alphaproteobacteria bacterium]|nr:hypothetical protein [Alphaproteobacteria bacterium]MCB9698506.1 hypothetical protein [Alphaproteobacteria bacterium]
MNEDFRDLLELLLEHHAEFLVVGAHALAVHGVARATGDLDLLVRPTPQNAARVLKALIAFGAQLGDHEVRLDDLADEDSIYQLGLPPRRIDLLKRLDGVSFDEAWEHRVVREVDGLLVPFLGRSDLVRNKRAVGRPQDLADIARLESETDVNRRSP